MSCARSKGRHARAGGKGHLTHAFPLEKIRNKLREAELSDLVNPYSLFPP